MADSVQEILDNFVPHLQDYLERNIFNKKEIQMIVARRRDSEYLLKRRQARKSDFLRYIQDEERLEKLRNLRWAKIVRNTPKNVVLKKGSGDQHVVNNINFIFTRMVTKFRSDISLVVQYAEFARKYRPHAIPQIFAKALTVHPRNAGLWLEAASAEYFHGKKGNSIQSARVLMQRGLRTNPKSVALWVGYAQLEWHYAAKLRGRRDILQIEADDDADYGVGNLIKGAAPKLILKQALDQLHDNNHLREEMVKLAMQFPGTEEFFKIAWDSLDDEDIKDPTSAALFKAKFAINHTDRLKLIMEADARYESLSAGANFSLQIVESFLSKNLICDDSFITVITFLENEIASSGGCDIIYKKIREYCLQIDDMSSAMYDYFVHFLLRTGASKEAYDYFEKAVVEGKGSVDLVIKFSRMRLEISNGNDYQDVQKMLKATKTRLAADDISTLARINIESIRLKVLWKDHYCCDEIEKEFEELLQVLICNIGTTENSSVNSSFISLSKILVECIKAYLNFMMHSIESESRGKYWVKKNISNLDISLLPTTYNY